ncbi:hypothetical protein ACLOJK_004444, partial [Asimina triloba]
SPVNSVILLVLKMVARIRFGKWSIGDGFLPWWQHQRILLVAVTELADVYYGSHRNELSLSWVRVVGSSEDGGFVRTGWGSSSHDAHSPDLVEMTKHHLAADLKEIGSHAFDCQLRGSSFVGQLRETPLVARTLDQWLRSTIHDVVNGYCVAASGFSMGVDESGWSTGSVMGLPMATSWINKVVVIHCRKPEILDSLLIVTPRTRPKPCGFLEKHGQGHVDRQATRLTV